MNPLSKPDEDTKMNNTYVSKSLLTAAMAVLIGGDAALAQVTAPQRDDILTKAPTLQTGREYRAESVQYDDLNLANMAGVRTLYRRIDAAAKKVCQPEPDIREMVMHKDWENCYDSALDRAVGSAQLPALSRYHLVQTGRIGEQAQQYSKAH